MKENEKRLLESIVDDSVDDALDSLTSSENQDNKEVVKEKIRNKIKKALQEQEKSVDIENHMIGGEIFDAAYAPESGALHIMYRKGGKEHEVIFETKGNDELRFRI